MRRHKLASAVVAALLLIAAGSYVAAQYESSTQPTSLSDLPPYPYAGSAFPFSNLSSQERAGAETTLRTFANSVEPGHHATSERYLASTDDFVWDAVRSSVSGYLSDLDLQIESVGQTPHGAGDLAYIVWARRNCVQRLFSDKRILAVGMQDPIRRQPAGGPVHVYGYFELSARS